MLKWTRTERNGVSELMTSLHVFCFIGDRLQKNVLFVFRVLGDLSR